MNRAGLSLIVAVALSTPHVFGDDRAGETGASGTASNMKPVPNWQQDWSFQNADGTYATRKGGLIRIGNASLERAFRFLDGSLGTIQLVNKLSGRPPGSQQWPEFKLLLSGAVKGELTAADFEVTDIALEGGRDPVNVGFAMRSRQYPKLTVQVMIHTPPGAKYQRKGLTINWAGEDDVTVDRVDVENAGGFGWWNIGNPTHVGMGQPMLVADLFLGLEHPAGEVSEEFLRHYPAASAKGGLKTRTAVWGVAKDAASVRQAFFNDYLTVAVAKPSPPFVIWNLIGLSIPEEKKCIEWMHDIDTRCRKAGITVDCYALDDLWQDTATVWRPAPFQFPNGFDPLTETLNQLNSRLGLWLSPVGSTLDTRWGKIKGLEITTLGGRTANGRYCTAGAKYQAEMKQVLGEYVTRNKVNYLKCDYLTFACEDPTHGHGIGPAGREAQIDGLMDIFRHVKRLAPDCRIAITTGAWLSPWWLTCTDYIWLGGNDGGELKEVKNLTPQDSGISYRDSVMYDDYMDKQYVFPHWALMTHGFWEWGSPTFEKFQDDVMMVIARGIAKYEILNSPSIMDEKRFAFLGKAIRWGKANWDILSDTRMILGNPTKGEVYGYSHLGRNAAIVFVRNPKIESRNVDLTFAALGLTPDSDLCKIKSLKAYEIYPAYRDNDWNGSAASPIAVHLLGSQTKCVVIVADEKLLDRLKLQ
jgi:hypothetical protein